MKEITVFDELNEMMEQSPLPKVKEDSWNEGKAIGFANWCRIHDRLHQNEVWTIQQLFYKWKATVHY